VKEADSVLSRLFSFPTAHSLEIVFWDGEFDCRKYGLVFLCDSFFQLQRIFHFRDY
jgi:hypothetical protein